MTFKPRLCVIYLLVYFKWCNSYNQEHLKLPMIWKNKIKPQTKQISNIFLKKNTSERPQLGLLVYYLQSYLQGYELILK